MKTIWTRLSVFVSIHVFILAAVAASAYADVLYDPPAGSRWIIQRDLLKEETTHEFGKTSHEKSTLKITAELTIKAKTPGGFHVTYARRKSAYEGDKAVAMRASLAALENIEIDGLAATLDRETAAALRNMMAGMTQFDAAKAAELYLDELADLAAGQNTGLKPGEERKTVVTLPNPIGPGFVTTRTLSMISADPAKGDAKLVLTEMHDPESLRAFIAHLLKQGGGNPNDAKQMDLAMDAKTDMDVIGGMVRVLKRESTTSKKATGNYVITKSFKTVTLTQAK